MLRARLRNTMRSDPLPDRLERLARRIASEIALEMARGAPLTTAAKTCGLSHLPASGRSAVQARLFADLSGPSSSAQLRATYEGLARVMQRAFGDLAEALADSGRPTFRVVLGEELVFVDLVSRFPAAPAISLNAMVVTGVEPCEELFAWLLERNRTFVFGALAAAPDSKAWMPPGAEPGETLTVSFEHGLLAAAASKDQLVESVRAAESIARIEGRTIVARWGGLRPHDRAALDAH